MILLILRGSRYLRVIREKASMSLLEFSSPSNTVGESGQAFSAAAIRTIQSVPASFLQPEFTEFVDKHWRTAITKKDLDGLRSGGDVAGTPPVTGQRAGGGRKNYLTALLKYAAGVSCAPKHPGSRTFCRNGRRTFTRS